MGWLARQFGLACDNVESYTLVTAEGDDRPRDRNREPRPVLGPPRRGRQLRRRHRIRIRSPPDDRPGTHGRALLRRLRHRSGRGGPRLARPAGRRAPRGDARLRRRHRWRVAVPAVTPPRPPGRVGRFRVGRRHRRRPPVRRNHAEDRDADRREHPDADLHRAADQWRRRSPPWPPALLGRPLPARVQRRRDRRVPRPRHLSARSPSRTG